jgi:hypothetical protein
MMCCDDGLNSLHHLLWPALLLQLPLAGEQKKNLQAKLRIAAGRDFYIMAPLPAKITMFFARYSLEYYVLHRALLQTIAAFMV